jgi:hypothetical protein
MTSREDTSSRAAERRGDPEDLSLDCFVSYRLLAMTPSIVILPATRARFPGLYRLFVILALVARIHEKAPEAASH